MSAPERKGNGDGAALPADAATAAEGGDHDDGPAAPGAAGEAALEESAALEQTPPTREELVALRRENAELRDSLLRRRAEFENYRRRAERDQAAAATDAAADIFRRFGETVDNLERALAAGGGEPALRQGVELTLRDLQAAMDAFGVTAVDPLGERFDPLRHQALLHEVAAGFAAGTVAEVYRKGYTYKERLLRPALVKVASDAAEGTGETGGGADVQ